MGPRRIIVGVDESEGAADALRWAVAEAGFDDAAVTAVMVWGWLDQHHLLETQRWDAEYGQDEAHAALTRYVEMSLGADAAERVTTRAVVGLPGATLVEQAADADLLVVGARGLGGFRGLLLGSVSQQCLHRASVPVAIIRAPRSRRAEPAGRVVAAVDGSEQAQRALHWAVEAARRRHATLDVVYAWQLPFVGYTPLGRNLFDIEVIEQASERLLAEAVAAEDVQGLTVRSIALRSETVLAVLKVAQGADLLVVGSRGRGAVERTLFGSVATQVSHHAPCPLVVVPPAQ